MSLELKTQATANTTASNNTSEAAGRLLGYTTLQSLGKREMDRTVRSTTRDPIILVTVRACTAPATLTCTSAAIYEDS